MTVKSTRHTAEKLLAHLQAYPHLTPQDVFKFLHQSAFGCEHLVTDEQAVTERLCNETNGLDLSVAHSDIEPLDGHFSRVHLGYLKTGLAAQTLGKLLCISSKICSHDVDELERKLDVARRLAAKHIMPFSEQEFVDAWEAWRTQGYPALHHSDAFRFEYHPAYRVIHNRYLPFLPLFSRLDTLLPQKRVLLAIEGGSASGKSTLGELLQAIYGCTVCHMDDFFLRPEQRTPERLSQVGGNIDVERFLDEVLVPLYKGEVASYRRYDCSTATVLPAVPTTTTPLTVIEGAYSMHPLAEGYYDLSVFLDVESDTQRNRIRKRNSPPMAERFFTEWIPLEERYFDHTDIRSRCDLIIPVDDRDAD